jgi:Na+/phosphate symporter
MAVNIIIRVLIAIFAVGIVVMLFFPIIYELAYNVPTWDNMPDKVLANRDNLYSIFLMIPLFAIGGILLWAYMASTRKTQDDY